MKKKKILIIGGTGFIGYYLAKSCLKKKWQIISFSKNRPSRIRKLKKVKYINGDLTKKKDFKKLNYNFDYVVNLGGYVNHTDRRKTFNSHYLGCKNLVNYFMAKKIKSFVQIGSSGEYGKLSSPHKETMKCNPQSIYSKAKFLASKFLINIYKKKKISSYNFKTLSSLRAQTRYKSFDTDCYQCLLEKQKISLFGW